MTPEMIVQMRALADEGRSRKSVASQLGISLAKLDYHASNAKVSFAKRTKSQRAKEFGPEMAAHYWPRMREVYKQELAREIAEAKKDMRADPLRSYKPPTDRNGEPL